MQKMKKMEWMWRSIFFFFCVFFFLYFGVIISENNNEEFAINFENMDENNEEKADEAQESGDI